jgi:hypothetical protein
MMCSGMRRIALGSTIYRLGCKPLDGIWIGFKIWLERKAIVYYSPFIKMQRAYEFMYSLMVSNSLKSICVSFFLCGKSNSKNPELGNANPKSKDKRIGILHLHPLSIPRIGSRAPCSG